MGSWCDLKVDGFSFYGSKSYIDELMLSLFQERDRRVAPDDNAQGAGCVFQYVVAAQSMRQRLDILGFTIERTRDDYARGHAEEIETRGGYDWLSPSEIERHKRNTFAYWSNAIQRLVPQGFQIANRGEWKHDPDAEMLSQNGEFGLGACFSDVRFLLRGVLEALRNANEVILDYTALVDAGYYENDEGVRKNAALRWAEEAPLFAPIVLLTEGRSDARILSEAIEVMAPDLADFYSFLEFEELRVPGGTDMVAKTVKAFAGAKISTRIVAIFDNDTAGVSAAASLGDLSLPANIRVIVLPRCEMGANYPTRGPQGIVCMDINGAACSLELYLGERALAGNIFGRLPVHWTAWDRRAESYQGEVEQKDEIQKRFLKIVREFSSPNDARLALPDLAAVVDAITAAFIDTKSNFNTGNPIKTYR